MIADGGCERDVVHKMNERVHSVESSEKCAEQYRITDECENVFKLFIWKINYTDGFVRNKGMGYEKC